MIQQILAAVIAALLCAVSTSLPLTSETAEILPVESAVPANPMTLDDVPEVPPVEEHGILYGIKIGIDPGHQAHGNNQQEPVYPGSKETKAKVSSGTEGVSTRIPEYQVNLQIALLLRDALEALDAEVYMTREVNDIDISNVERAVMMNDLGVAVVLRLHCNGSENKSTNGIGLYVKPDGEGAKESYAISEMLLPAMGEATGAKTESIHVRDIYSGLNWSTVPSILVEMGYMSNPDEDEALCSDEYQAMLVDGMVNGLVDYFVTYGIVPVEPEPTPTAEPTPEPTEAPADAPETEASSAPDVSTNS